MGNRRGFKEAFPPFTYTIGTRHDSGPCVLRSDGPVVSSPSIALEIPKGLLAMC